MAVKITAALALIAGMSMAQVKRVAVVETETDAQSGAAAKINKAEVRQITAALRREAVNNLPQDKYYIMTSETVIAQGSAKLEECADENCVITLGAKIGADYIVRGTVSKLGAKLTVTVEMYETDDGNLVASSDLAASDDVPGLLEKAAAACAEMYKKFDGWRSLAQKAAVTHTNNNAPTPPPTYQSSVSTPTPAPTYQQAVEGGRPSFTAFTDKRDGKTYNTVRIGGQRWMAENLNYDKGKSWCYSNEKFNCGKYGRLYDWKTAKTVCPAGYHLPSSKEWDNMVASVGGSNVAGKKLKAKSGWYDNGNGTDEYGFSALLGGGRGTDGTFSNAGSYGYWWTASGYGGGLAYYRYMNYNDDFVSEYSSVVGWGFSVRCVQD